MAYSFVVWTADGLEAEFKIIFSSEAGIDSRPYLSRKHVYVKVNDKVQVETVDYNLTESAGYSIITFVEGRIPSANSKVKIYRHSPKTILGRIVDFQDGAVLTENDLDTSAIHQLYLAQEAQDTGNGGMALNSAGDAWDALEKKIINVEDPEEEDGVVNKRYADNLALYGGGTINPQFWTFTAVGGTTAQFTLEAPVPTTSVNEQFIVSVEGHHMAPNTTLSQFTSIRDYDVTEDEITGTYYLGFQSGAFPDNTGYTDCPPAGSKIYVHNFGITRNVFSTPLTLTPPYNGVTPLTINSETTYLGDETVKAFVIKGVPNEPLGHDEYNRETVTAIDGSGEIESRRVETTEDIDVGTSLNVGTTLNVEGDAQVEGDLKVVGRFQASNIPQLVAWARININTTPVWGWVIHQPMSYNISNTQDNSGYIGPPCQNTNTGYNMGVRLYFHERLVTLDDWDTEYVVMVSPRPHLEVIPCPDGEGGFFTPVHIWHTYSWGVHTQLDGSFILQFHPFLDSTGNDREKNAPSTFDVQVWRYDNVSPNL